MYHSQNYANLDTQSDFLNESSYNFTNVKKQAFTIIYIFMLVFISVSILLYVSQVLNINKKSTKLLNLENKLETIQAKNERLEVKLASKTSLAEIENIAKHELNMVEAKTKETLVYNNQFRKKERYMADIPKEKFFLVQIYDKIIKEVVTVQAESLE
ncbi:septum formation initiator family protein [Halanaerobium congolense]|jgi:cell division protein FtsB|uniref:Cell division protein FtsL n=1 Tax=Halanaerobium congolense TaxID=54121 RepID=A0A1G6HLF9_9FIRM|nr:cell division protein FtsL [Halanaerobium congolense]OEG63127.1 MAG: septum formation inhibitor [Halanaerobium sp. MDAL1]PTX16842.1 cell division protein FtsL [Halanaerobium congolense]TDP26962.1 cell division protein FtsL [Halanaerobium congolense]TDS33109.1 cell division protein FtsL [Halanaerobium congolense]SDB95024.1 Septum formation initiator [Halanaerobium congolense]